MPSHFRFDTHRGVRRASPDEIASVIFEVLDDAAHFLLEANSSLPRLLDLKKAVDQIRNGNLDRRLALLAGLGTTPTEAESRWNTLKSQACSDIDQEIVEAVFSPAAERLVIRGTCQAALMFGSLAPDVSEADAVLLARKLIEYYSPSGDPHALRQLVHSTPVEQSDERAWRQGYDLASEVLDAESRLLGLRRAEKGGGVFEGGLELVEELLVPTADDLDTAHVRGALRREGGDDAG